MSRVTPEEIAKPDTESAHQKALFQQCNLHLAQYPELIWFFAVPNGGARGDNLAMAQRRGADLKMQGVKAGVLDTILLVPRHGYHGLLIEMKKPGHLKKTSPEQKQFIKWVREQGYAACVCDNWQSAWKAIVRYLEG